MVTVLHKNSSSYSKAWETENNITFYLPSGQQQQRTHSRFLCMPSVIANSSGSLDHAKNIEIERENGHVHHAGWWEINSPIARIGSDSITCKRCNPNTLGGHFKKKSIKHLYSIILVCIPLYNRKNIAYFISCHIVLENYFKNALKNTPKCCWYCFHNSILAGYREENVNE